MASSAYNLRQDECKAAAYNLLAYAGLPYGKFKDAYLRNVPREVFFSYKDKLPENFRKRAEHFFGEIKRAEDGAEAWQYNGPLVKTTYEKNIVNKAHCLIPEEAA